MKKYKLRGWLRTLLLIIILELILVSYLFLYSDRITNIESKEQDNEIANVFVERWLNWKMKYMIITKYGY